jgi:hypothetical protein
MNKREFFMTKTENDLHYSRKEFLHLCARGAGICSVASALPKSMLAQASLSTAPAQSVGTSSPVIDLRDFVRWIVDDFEPSIRLPGGAGRYPRQPGQNSPALYGVADMACVLYTIGALDPSTAERAQWADAFELFQNPQTGWFREKDPVTLSPQHNTAFALAAMQLLDLKPQYPVKMDAEYARPRAYLDSLDWRNGVYRDSHKGAGVGSIYALVPALRSPGWFSEYFSACDDLFQANNGLMGQRKPAGGDVDQVGGTFHYSFLYRYFNRSMPYPEHRIDSILGLQQPDGYWTAGNHLWMTLDAIYLMTRTLRYNPHRMDDVRSSVRRAIAALERDVFSPEGRKKTVSENAGVHSLTAAINIAAEAQQFFGAQEVITDWPLKLVLDRRPFI